MSIYFVPALAALLFKLFVLAYVLRGGKVSVVFLSLIIVFAAHNAIEIVGYFQFISGQVSDVFIRLYYVATAFAILYMLLHGLAVSRLESVIIMSTLIAVATVVSALTLFSDLLITGQYSIGYTISATKGHYYWLFATYMLIFLSCNFAVLIYGHSAAKSRLDSVRCVHSLLALTPIMLVFTLAVIFKVADVAINATGLVPIATAIFLAIVLKTESKHRLSDLTRLMPMSMERQTSNQFMDLLDGYINNSNQDNAYKTLQAGIEREIIMYSLKKCDNNVSHTTKMMGLKNRSTLYSMMNRLDIDMQELKQQQS